MYSGYMHLCHSSNKVGGTAFIGISKPVIKAHGSSDATSFFAAVRQAVAVVNAGVSSPP